MLQVSAVVSVRRDGQVDIRRLERFDLEALVVFKLHAEVGVELDACRELVRTSSASWLTLFIEHGGSRIGHAAIDVHMIARARAHVLAQIAPMA